MIRKKRLVKKICWGGGGLFLLHLLVIVGYGLLSQPQKADYLVVLGSKVAETGVPATRLQYRLNKGAELYHAGMAPKVIVSGGIGIEGFDEAEVMAAYLIEKGVPNSAIFLDNQGNNTYASAQNCWAMMRADSAQSMIIVSQYFHLLRAKMAFARMGIPDCTVAAADWFFEGRDVYSLPREMIGLYYYLFRSYPE